METHFHNASGKPYSAIDWLDDHHSIKSRLRSELIRNLPIKTGSRVLDLGCGTGSWTFLIAEMIGHTGKIVGIDLDCQAIERAERRREYHYQKQNMRFEIGDLTTCSFDEKFDVILLFNALSYQQKPEILLQHLSEMMDGNCILLVKDSDIGSDFYWPVDLDLYHRIMLRIAHAAGECAHEGYDPFLARRIPGYLHAMGFTDINVISQSFSFSYPVDPLQRRYITENGKMIADAVKRAGDQVSASKWVEQFQEGEESIFENRDFLYTMTEFIFHARMPDKS